MIEFDLEKALSGEKVITRDGRPITQLVKFKTHSGSVLYGFDCDNDHVEQWLVDGSYHDTGGVCGGDLFMAPKKLSGYICYHTDGTTKYFKDKPVNVMYEDDLTLIVDLSKFEEGHGL